MSPQDVATLLDHHAGLAQQSSNRAQTVENTHYHCGLVKAYHHAAALIEVHLVPRWRRDVPTKPGFYLRRFDKGYPVYMETYVLDPDGVLCWAADPDDGIAYGRPLGTDGFAKTSEWCPIAAPLDP